MSVLVKDCKLNEELDLTSDFNMENRIKKDNKRMSLVTFILSSILFIPTLIIMIHKTNLIPLCFDIWALCVIIIIFLSPKIVDKIWKD